MLQYHIHDHVLEFCPMVTGQSYWMQTRKMYLEALNKGMQRFFDPIGVVMRNNGQIVVAVHGSWDLTNSK